MAITWTVKPVSDFFLGELIFLWCESMRFGMTGHWFIKLFINMKFHEGHFALSVLCQAYEIELTIKRIYCLH